MSTSLSGVTSVPGRVVRVHREDNGQVVGWTVSNPSTGAWSVDTTSAARKCYAIELDCDDIGPLGIIQSSLMNPTAGSTTFSEYFGNTITSVGDIVSTASNPPPLTGVSTSAYCDGTGDNILLSNTVKISPGHGDFCFEVFARPLYSGNAYRTILVFSYSGGYAGYIRYGDLGFGSKLQVAVNETGVSAVYSCARTQSGDNGLWGLYSLERYKGDVRLYYNGTIQNLNNGVNPSTFPYSAITDKSEVSGITDITIGAILGNVGPWRLMNLAPYRGSNFTVPSAPWPQSFGSGDVNALILSGLTPG